MELVNRPLYLQQLKKLLSREEVKILTGVRGVGKTSLLDLFAQDLLNSGVDSENIIRLDFDTCNFKNLNNEIQFYDMLAPQMSDTEKNFLLLDEITQIPNWQSTISKLKENFNADIYITSSLEVPETHFVNLPVIFVKVMPLSFKEFQSFYQFADDVPLQARFDMYLKFGGMPLAIQSLPNDSAAISALANSFYSSILRDVVVGSKITDFDLMVELVRKIFEKSGTIQSYNKFSKMFSDNPPAVRTVENYVNHLCDAHILYALTVTDFRRDNTLKRLAKYYPVDFGYSTLLVGQQEISQSVLECVVYCELLRRGFEVSAYRVRNTLVFQVERGELGDRIYISVVKSVNDSSYAPLRAIKNLFAKWIITADEKVSDSEDGVKVANVLDFLMNEQKI